MSQEHPELVFVTGPQAGQRVLLNRAGLVIGRGAGADIQLSEDFASRRQGRLDLLRAGATFENLSDKGTWINGKRYKAGRQVLLETGDIIGVGAQTELLFVAAGDDPRKAVDDWSGSTPRRSAFKKKAEKKARETPQRQAPPSEAAPAAPAEASEPDLAGALLEAARQPDRPHRLRPSEMSAQERLDAESKAKRRKLVVGLGTYFGIILVIGVVLWVMGTPTTQDVGVPPYLDGRMIDEALEAPFPPAPRPLSYEKEIQNARRLHMETTRNPRKLHECLVAFKKALAYSGRSVLATEDHGKYIEVRDKLAAEIRKQFYNAYVLAQDKKWREAEEAFHGILTTVSDESSPIFQLVQRHYKRVKYLRQEKTPEKRQPWQ